jgi:aminopeptidase-like protein
MNVNMREPADESAAGGMYRLIAELFPICRSITGEGVRESLAILTRYIPLQVREVPSGTRVFDWVVPKEWNIRKAHIRDSGGKTILDFRNSNLHVLNYSAPISGRMPLERLKEHLHTLPEHPDWIPYRTSYYKENWGFCLSHNQMLGLADGDYEVLVDASLQDGHLTFGEYFLPGQTEAEILISTHICHPSLANDNLSGIALAVFLAQHMMARAPRKYSYRFLFTPGTIGSIIWLSLNESRAARIKHGLIFACVGDPGRVTYKKSRRGDAEIDRAVIQVLKDAGAPYEVLEFSPYGYDERQFCSPGFNLPVGCFMRTPHGRFPQYHTSADDLDLVRPEWLADSLSKALAIMALLEGNGRYMNLNPKCEPQLGKRGLYGSIGGQSQGRAHELAMLWVLNLSDGNNTLLDIAEKSGLMFGSVQSAAAALQGCGLLEEIV